MLWTPTLVVVCALTASLTAQTSTHERISDPAAPVLAGLLQGQGFDVLEGSVSEGALELIVSPEERAALLAQGYELQTLAVGRPFREIQAERAAAADVPAGYPDLAAVMAQMNAMAAAFPGIARVVDLTARYGMPTTFEGRHLFAMKISDNVSADEDEPAALIVSCHHCRELVTPVIGLDLIDRLSSGYGSDPTITSIVDNNEIWVAPVWNPDGYEHVFNVDNLWRKNRRVFATGTGVDLNRNYPFGWTAACSGSSSAGSSTYKGPGAASEAETQTMIAWTNDRHFAKVLDFHSSGREVLWGYACTFHPLTTFLQSEAVTLSQASGYGGQERPPSAEGEHYEWQLSIGAKSNLTETALSFQPSHASAVVEAGLVWPGTRLLLSRPGPLSGHVTDACTGAPLAADIDIPAVGYTNGETHFSDARLGRYHAYLPNATYDVVFSAAGYESQTHSVTVAPSSPVTLDVALVPSAGCWTDHGFAKTGSAGDPLLVGTGTLASLSSNQIDLSSANPLSTATLVFGISGLFAPLKGGVLVPDPLLLLPLGTDGSGSLSLPFLMPSGVFAGLDLYFQFWIADPGASEGLSASNGISGRTH